MGLPEYSRFSLEPCPFLQSVDCPKAGCEHGNDATTLVQSKFLVHWHSIPGKARGDWMAGRTNQLDDWAKVQGSPTPLGARWIDSAKAWNFALYSTEATAVVSFSTAKATSLTPFVSTISILK